MPIQIWLLIQKHVFRHTRPIQSPQPIPTMKTILPHLVLLAALSFATTAPAQPGAFTYEGRLAEHGAPASGTYEFEFTLWDSASGGQSVTAATLGTPGGVTVTAGRFVVVLDFGAGALNGQPRWIELAVRAHGGTAPFSVIAPRQGLPVAPYAVFATVAGGAADGTINTPALAANAVTAPKIAAGQVVKGINNLQDAVTLQAGPNVRLNTRGNTITISAPAAPDTNSPAWSLTGNAGTDASNFLGTTDGQPLELRVNNTRALRLELNALGRPNLIGGNTNNRAAGGLTGVVIAGGASNIVELAANYATVAGGLGNAIGSNSPAAVISGGRDNAIRTNATMAVVAGGQRNLIQDGAANSAISGGTRNTIGINATNATILGGSLNTISNDASFAAILGGTRNVAAGRASLAAGTRATALHDGAFVWADSRPGAFATTGSNQFLIRATGGVGIGTNQPVSALHVLGTVTATSFVGNGVGLTNLKVAVTNFTGQLNPAQIPNLDAAKITTGLFAPAQIPALDAARLITGTLADARLSANVPRLNSSPSFAGTVTAAGFTGSGANLTALNGANVTAATIIDAAISPAAAIADTKLATLRTAGKVVNSATTATSTNIPNAIVARDAAGNFAAGTITATAFVGDGSRLTRVGAERWLTVSNTALTAQANKSYLLTSAAATTVALPDAAVLGDTVRVSGAGAGDWQIAPGAGQTIVGSGVTPAGIVWTARDTNRNWVSVASSADGTKLVALANGGADGDIYTSADSGETWTPQGILRKWGSVASSANGTKLVAADKGGQLYTSTDSGVTWIPRDTNRSWISVASSADGAKLVALASAGKIYTSTDSGETWIPRDENRNWVAVASSDDGIKLVAASTVDFIYTSNDSGETWTPRDEVRIWHAVASSADGTRLVAVDYFGTGDGGRIYTSDDSGETWIPRESNRTWLAVASSADGAKLVAISDPTGVPGRSVTKSLIGTSTDFGVTWTVQPTSRYFSSVASSANGDKLVAAGFGAQIYTSTPRTNVLPGIVGGNVTLQYIGGGQWQPLDLRDDQNTPNAIVQRDAVGNFSAGTITATAFYGRGTIPIGGIIMWSGDFVPSGWALCDGQAGRPDLRDRFVVGAGSRYPTGEAGGNDEIRIGNDNLPIFNYQLPVRTVGYTSAYNNNAEAIGAPGGARNNETQFLSIYIYRPNNPLDIRPQYYALAFIMRVE